MFSHTEESRARIARGQRRAYERRQKAAQLGPKDLARWRRSGLVSAQLRPLVDAAGIEAGEVIEALGGPEVVTPQQRAICDDVARLGVVLNALLGAFVQQAEPDLEIAAKVGSLASARRAGLVAVGLQRVARELDLNSYLREREAGLQAADGQPVDNQPENPEAPRALAADPQTGELVVEAAGLTEEEAS